MPAAPGNAPERRACLSRRRAASWRSILRAPEGPLSLLEWIDAYFAHPETDLDRMMGKYENVVKASVVIPDPVRGRVHVKTFGYHDGSGCGEDNAYPYKHGHFNQPGVPFWRPEFWHPGKAGCEAIKRGTADPAPAGR